MVVRSPLDNHISPDFLTVYQQFECCQFFSAFSTQHHEIGILGTPIFRNICRNVKGHKLSYTLWSRGCFAQNNTPCSNLPDLKTKIPP